MTALQVVLIVFFSIMGLGLLIFLLMLARYYLTPTGGDITVFVDPGEEDGCRFKVDLDSHPLTWQDKKSIRFRVNVRKPDSQKNQDV